MARVKQLEDLLKKNKIVLPIAPKSEGVKKLPSLDDLKPSTELLTEGDSKPPPEKPKQLKEPEPRLLTATEILRQHQREQKSKDQDSWVVTGKDDD